MADQRDNQYFQATSKRLQMRTIKLLQKFYELPQQSAFVNQSRKGLLDLIANLLHQAVPLHDECHCWLFLESEEGMLLLGSTNHRAVLSDQTLAHFFDSIQASEDIPRSYPEGIQSLLLHETNFYSLDLKSTQRGTQAQRSRLHILISANQISEQDLAHIAKVIADSIRQTLDLFDTVRIIKQQEKVFDTIPMPMSLTDANGIIHRINPAFSTASGFPPEELIGHTHDVLKSDLNPDDVYQQLWQTISAGDIWNGELANKRKTGDIFWEELTIIPLKSNDGPPYAYVSIKRPTTEEHRLAIQAQYQAEHDQLTGLLNSSRMRRDLQKLLSDNASGGLIFADIGSLSRINQSLGLDAGDKVLQDAARALERAQIPLNNLYRYNGDTFAVVVESPSSVLRERVASIVDSIHKQCLDGANYESSIIPFNLHIGIVRFPEDGTDVIKLLGRGTLALRSAKRAQNPEGTYFSVGEETKLQRQSKLDHDIQRALRCDQLRLWYQPKVDARTHTVAAAEALLRWMHPELGWISPEEFIPVAERNRTIIDIGRWVIEQAIRDAASWQKHLGPVAIAFNLSAIQLFDSQLLPTLKKALAIYQLPPKLVVVELTESVLIEQPEFALTVLEQMIDIGVRVSIDDFGTGYSSMSYLRDFPVHEIKIDRSLISNVASNPAGAVIVNTILSLGKHLDLAVVAEGVEQRSEAAYLRAKGCDLLQGFLFSKPLPNLQFIEQVEQIDKLSDINKQTVDAGILFLDDEPNILRSLKRELRREPYPCFFAEDAEEAFELLANHNIAVVVSDQRMPDMRGTDFLGRVHKLYPTIIRIMLSGYTDSDSVIEAINTGVVSHFLTKPWEGRVLKETLSDARRRYHLESENRKTEGRLEQLSYEYMIDNFALDSGPYHQAIEQLNEVVSIFFSSSFKPTELNGQLSSLLQSLQLLKADHPPHIEEQFNEAISLIGKLINKRSSVPIKGHDTEVLNCLAAVRMILLTKLEA